MDLNSDSMTEEPASKRQKTAGGPLRDEKYYIEDADTIMLVENVLFKASNVIIFRQHLSHGAAGS
jgi:hypothetical protein